MVRPTISIPILVPAPSDLGQSGADDLSLSSAVFLRVDYDFRIVHRSGGACRARILVRLTVRPSGLTDVNRTCLLASSAEWSWFRARAIAGEFDEPRFAGAGAPHPGHFLAGFGMDALFGRDDYPVVANMHLLLLAISYARAQ